MESQAKWHYIGKLYGGNLIELKDPPETKNRKVKVTDQYPKSIGITSLFHLG